jgi:hypothetical protein
MFAGVSGHVFKKHADCFNHFEFLELKDILTLNFDMALILFLNKC